MGLCLLDWSAWRRLPKMSRMDAAAFLATAVSVLAVNAVLAVAIGCARVSTFASVWPAASSRPRRASLVARGAIGRRAISCTMSGGDRVYELRWRFSSRCSPRPLWAPVLSGRRARRRCTIPAASRHRRRQSLAGQPGDAASARDRSANAQGEYAFSAGRSGHLHAGGRSARVQEVRAQGRGVGDAAVPHARSPKWKSARSARAFR